MLDSKKQFVAKISTLITGLLIIVFLSYKIYTGNFFITYLFESKRANMLFIEFFFSILSIMLSLIILKVQKSKNKTIAIDTTLMLLSLVSIFVLMSLSWIINTWSYDISFIFMVSLITIFFALGISFYGIKNNYFFKLYIKFSIILSARFLFVGILASIIILVFRNQGFEITI